jgi:hypothetical protein
MNHFQHQHRHAINFSYSCFDHIVCNGYIQRLQQPGSIIWFLKNQRQADALSRSYFSGISANYHRCLDEKVKHSAVPLVQPPDGVRRQDFVEPFFQQLGHQAGLAVILKCREAERIAVSDKNCHIDMKRRHVNLYYFYLQDACCGRMFIRLCPYFPFNIRVWLNGHGWLAQRLKQEGIEARLHGNVFVACANPERLQQLSDAFAPEDISNAVDACLPQVLCYFSDAEQTAGYRHRLFMSQMEYCHNFVFHNKLFAARLFDRLMDVSRSIGTPDKLAIIFGRSRFHPDTRTGELRVKVTSLRTPVISAGFKGNSIKQYLKAGGALRLESSSYQLRDLSLPKDIRNLPRVREVLGNCNERYLNTQQDILESHVDAGQLQELRQATVSAAGRRTPGLRLDDPRLLALLQALCCFVHLLGHGRFRSKDLLTDVHKALDNPNYKLSQLRYDLGKLRGKGLVKRVQGTQRYELSPTGYRIAVLYLKLYQRLYAPLTAGILTPVATDKEVLTNRTAKLDRLYLAVDQALQKLTDYVGIAA